MLSEMTEKEILYDLIYTWNLKNQTQTNRSEWGLRQWVWGENGWRGWKGIKFLVINKFWECKVQHSDKEKKNILIKRPGLHYIKN